MSPPPPVTPDGRYLVVRGRLWRRANPHLPEEERQSLVDALMRARRAVRDALRSGDPGALRAARANVDIAKRSLGERGPVWWTDGAPDENRRMAKNSGYALWWRGIEGTTAMGDKKYRAERLRWTDELLGEIDLPKAVLRMTRGVGSGLTRRADDAPGIVWAAGDRGPNFKVEVAIDRYGVAGLDHLREVDGAKIMPAPDHGPALVELRIDGDAVTPLRTLPLRGRHGRPLSGLPIPTSDHREGEPIHSLGGEPLGTDPGGVDSEGVAAAADGGFWVGDEYGPSLLRLDADGRVELRWVPQGCPADGEAAGYPVQAALPAIAAKRRLNRGFEAIATSPDCRGLFLAFQSPLAHPDRAAHAASRNVRLWRLDTQTGECRAEYVYRLEPADAFRRDVAKGKFKGNDVKVSELLVLADDRLLVLERGSASTKFFIVDLSPGQRTPPAMLDPETRPTLEQMDEAALAAAGVAPLAKTLLLDTDDAPELPADLEGMVLLSPTELLLVNDNDFGVEGVETEFWRVTFDEPIA